MSIADTSGVCVASRSGAGCAKSNLADELAIKILKATAAPLAFALPAVVLVLPHSDHRVRVGMHFYHGPTLERWFDAPNSS